MKKTILVLSLLMLTVVGLAQTPDWHWAAQAGGIGWDEGYSIILDNAGNSYVTGYFDGTATFGSHTLISNGYWDIFVAKMDTSGNWQWATQAGGLSEDIGYALTIDGTGNIYVTGTFNLLATFGSHSLTSSGSSDLFVAKLDDIGNWLWATQAGGSYGCSVAAIDIDDFDNCYITGSFGATAYFGSYYINSNGSGDIFVAKIDSDGSWQWAIQAGGTAYETGNAISTNFNGISYITGYFQETTTCGSDTLTSIGEKDIFVAKIDADGNLEWAAQAGGTNWDIGNAIAIGDDGNSYVTGYFYDMATFGSYTLTSSGSHDIFAAKIDTYGNWLWATQAGGIAGNDVGNAIAIDNAGNSYITGKFGSIATFGSHFVTTINTDLFVAKADDGGNWLWAAQAGNGDVNFATGLGIGIDAADCSYVTGVFDNTVFFGSYSLTSSGVTGAPDLFVAKLGSETSAENEIIPATMELSNYPNPFNPSTTTSFQLNTETAEKTELSIYNLKGQKIKNLSPSLCHPSVAGHSPEFIEGRGEYRVIWNGKDDTGKPISSGVYFYKLKSGDFEKTKKMLLLK